MTTAIVFPSETAINYANDLLNKKAWAEQTDQPKYVTRAAAIRLALDWAVRPAAISPEVANVATAATVAERANQIMAYVLAGGALDGSEYAWAPITAKSISNLIDWLKPLPRKANVKAAPVAPAKQERVELEDGMYMVDGTIYKVQHSLNSDRQYAKVAHIESIPGSEGAGSDTWSVSFSYAPGAIAKIRPEHKMSYEQAKEFGALYGTCCRCGRTLNDELSVALGIGPVCGGREFGGEFKAIIKAAKLELKKS